MTHVEIRYSLRPMT